jgi:hypothetical protein
MLEEHEVVEVAAGAPLPRVGDAFVIGNVTGYSSELACDFNGIARPALELLA